MHLRRGTRIYSTDRKIGGTFTGEISTYRYIGDGLQWTFEVQWDDGRITCPMLRPQALVPYEDGFKLALKEEAEAYYKETL